jgi:hypothetical protein
LTKSVNVLTKQEEQEELLLEAISKINNLELKAQYLEKLRKLLNKQETSKHNLPKLTISLSETFERFNKLKIKKVNIEDLQLEVNQIKNEIKQLKTDNNNLQDRLSILEINI